MDSSSDDSTRTDPQAGDRSAWRGPEITGSPVPTGESAPEGRNRGEMGFFDHLEELRGRIIRALIGFAVASALAGWFYRDIIEIILLGPARDAQMPLINTVPMGQLLLAIQVSLLSGLIIAIPWIIWQFWQFVRPGLYQREQRYVGLIAFSTIGCFLAGVAFAYFVMIPASLGFISGFEFSGIKNQIAITEYFSFVLGFIIALGVVFEMPVIAWALTRLGIVTPKFFRTYRRHAVVVILIAAAIITPTPDPFNQLLLAIPLYALFEVSILVSQGAARQRRRMMEAEGMAVEEPEE